MKRWNLEKIKEHVKTFDFNIKVLETKVENKKRKVYVQFNGKSGWTSWSSLSKGVKPTFKVGKYDKDKFLKVLKEKHPHIKLIENYTLYDKEANFYCENCKLYFEAVPKNIINSIYGCRSCSIRERNENNSRRFTQKEFEDKVFNEVGDEYIVVSKYINYSEKVTFLHKKCNKEIRISPAKFFSGVRCNDCGNKQRGINRRVTHEEFLKRVSDKFDNKYEIIGTYTIKNNKIQVKHRDCGHITEMLPSNILKGYGCKICSDIKRGFNRRKPFEDFKNELETIYPNRFEILEYEKNSSDVFVRCKTCDNVFYRTGNDLINNGACEYCSRSSLELSVSEVLDKYNIEYILQKTFEDLKYIKKLRIDFYLPNHNVAIEANGKQHYEPILMFGGQKSFEESNKRYNIKVEYFKKNNIKLIEIPYNKNSFYEIENILKENDIV